MIKTIDQEQIETAVDHLRAGELVAFPTETVYGLGADASNPDAVQKIFEAKGRPTDHPLIVHVVDVDQAKLWVREFGDQASKLAEAFWPGPLTMVLYKNGRAADGVVGGLQTIALRVPEHPVALELLAAFDGGLAGPSANKFGTVSPTTASHVEADLGEEIDYVLDGGKCSVGVESTIVDLTGAPAILRPGGVSKEQILGVLGEGVLVDRDPATKAPGNLKSHYKPNAKVVVVAASDIDEFEIPDGAAVVSPVNVEVANLWTMPADAQGYARSLYAVLREVDYRKFETVVVVPPTEGEIIDAVVDRLTKAAAPSGF